MSAAQFRCIHLDHPSRFQLEPVLEEFERGLSGRKLHETARTGLSGVDSLTFQEPFPKIESHDAYLYGVLATPTDIDDGRSEFFNIQFIISDTMAVTVLWGPEEHARTRSAKLFGQICADVNEISSRERTSGEDPGDAVVRISRVIIADLQQLLSSLHAAVQKEMAEIESAIFHKQYQSMSAKAGLKYEQISRLKFEILSISSTISETQNVFKAVSKGDVVIRAPFVSKDSDVPPFSAEQRIWIADLLMRARSLKAQRNGLEEEVRLLYERLESLENRRQTAAQMRFAAVASILLLPALVVGFFGQNFNINPWSESEWAWEISAGLLAVLAASQWIYFKVKKWF